jgi:lipid A 4'-phosphatase
VQAIYRGTPWIARGFGLLLALTLACSYLPRAAGLRARRGTLWFVLLALALGPGLITNTVLKDHWGRPRPVQIREFGGSEDYRPPWAANGPCARNCSFVGGHAAMGFFVITGAWVWPRRRRTWLLAGLASGALVGAARIVQGGHFLSDIVGALAVVWLVNESLFRLFLTKGWLAPPA